MNRNSLTILKPILLGLLVLQAIMGIVYYFVHTKKGDDAMLQTMVIIATLLFYISIYGIQLEAVYKEQFTVVAICMVLKVLLLVIEADGKLLLLTWFLGLIVVGVMVAYLVNLRAIRNSSTPSDTQPNSDKTNSFATVTIDGNSKVFTL